ncbi:MAG TPA: acyl carrier protein [bacterium]|nr:acyl carrier protein [bacterium]HOL48561.1 acyl carrier protein [bacterium]HPQ19449.1 acyl carrier protein [bacterium]
MKNNINLDDEIKEVMADIFGIEKNLIEEFSSPETIPNWDSLRHMNLILSLEKKFNIQFTPDEMMELLNFKLIYTIVKEKYETNN